MNFLHWLTFLQSLLVWENLTFVIIFSNIILVSWMEVVLFSRPSIPLHIKFMPNCQAVMAWFITWMVSANWLPCCCPTDMLIRICLIVRVALERPAHSILKRLSVQFLCSKRSITKDLYVIRILLTVAWFCFLKSKWYFTFVWRIFEQYLLLPHDLQNISLESFAIQSLNHLLLPSSLYQTSWTNSERLCTNYIVPKTTLDSGRGPRNYMAPEHNQNWHGRDTPAR